LFARSWGIRGASGGTDPAAAVDTAFAPQVISSILGNLAVLADTDIVNVTESGMLLQLSARIDNNTGGTGEASFDIQIDGGSTVSIPLFHSGAQRWADEIRGFAHDPILIGNAANHVILLSFFTRYLTSLRVSLNVTNIFAAGDSLRVSALRAIEA